MHTLTLSDIQLFMSDVRSSENLMRNDHKSIYCFHYNCTLNDKLNSSTKASADNSSALWAILFINSKSVRIFNLLALSIQEPVYYRIVIIGVHDRENDHPVPATTNHGINLGDNLQSDFHRNSWIISSQTSCQLHIYMTFIYFGAVLLTFLHVMLHVNQGLPWNGVTSCQ